MTLSVDVCIVTSLEMIKRDVRLSRSNDIKISGLGCERLHVCSFIDDIAPTEKITSLFYHEQEPKDI